MKTKLLLYCTKNGQLPLDGLVWGNEGKGLVNKKLFPYAKDCPEHERLRNGKIVAECECEVEEIKYKVDCPFPYLEFERELPKTCLTYEQLEDYLFPKKGYARHISNIKVFDKPNNLESCVYFKNTHEPKMSINRSHYEVLHKAPKNAMRVIFNKEEYILLSASPTEMCNILNGKQTIIVRKKVLKGMM